MATVFVASNRHADESDYGSDFSQEEEQIIEKLLGDLKDASETSAEDIEDPILKADLEAAVAADLFDSLPLDEEEIRDVSATTVEAASHDESSLSTTARIPAQKWTGLSVPDIEDALQQRSLPPAVLAYPDLSRALVDLSPGEAQPQEVAQQESYSPPAEDHRSPIERFRTFPKKPLTVTDFSAGAWCELQYWYTLTLLPGGRKTRTPAMRGGTKVHKILEEQVHKAVEIDVTRKEEAFALRLWNLIEGLRTLRETGLTRELEVWGSVNGQIVNGVIDEVSYAHPNAVLQDQFLEHQVPEEKTPEVAPTQSSITEYFEPNRRLLYLTDIKTRGSKGLPSGATLRPYKVQLFLYHRMLGNMAAGKLDFSAIIQRYGLHPDVRFSDAFMAQVGALHDEIFEAEGATDISGISPQYQQDGLGPSNGYPADPSPAMNPAMSPSPDQIHYRSIQQIIPLVEAELRDTFPQGAETLGNIVTIEYRHRDDGHIMGHQSFEVAPEDLDRYLDMNLAWWLGKRQPFGVPIEESYKCRICEFAEGCAWRKEKEEEFLQRAKEHAAANHKS